MPDRPRGVRPTTSDGAASDDLGAAVRAELGVDGAPPSRAPRGRSILPSFAQIATAAWRLVGIGLAVSFAFLFFLRLRLVMLPLIVALLAATLLAPIAGRLVRLGINRLLVTWLVYLSGVGLVALVVLVLAPQTVDQFDQLGRDLARALREIEEWLVEGPLGLSEEQVEGYIDQGVEQLSADTGAVTSRVLSGAAVAGEILAGLALTLVLSFFFVKDGDRIVAWALGHLPPDRVPPARAAGRRAWETLAGYLRGTASTGLIDAIFIGIGLTIMEVPLVLPLAILTFFGAFFPVVGAPLAGLVAVLVALVSGGPGDALAVLLLVFLVQQVESYLLAPMIMSRAVQLHPVVVLVALTGGGIVAGIIGAFLAVPLTAVSVAVVSELRRWESGEAELGPPGPPVEPPLAAGSG